jgi:heme A synthase
MISDRKNIINVITFPLGFFALALLIVEGFLGIILIFSNEQDLKFHFWGMIIGAILFVIVVIIVGIIVWDRPGHLTLEGKDYRDIEMEKMRATYNESPKSATEKSINKIFKTYLEKYE